MKMKKSFQKSTEKLQGSERHGIVLTCYGPKIELEDTEGSIIPCHLRKNMEPVTTGDNVLWLPEDESASTGIVVKLLPRKSLLGRPENPHKIKLVAANIDTIIIVIAPPPLLSEEMIDRYLVAAEMLGIQPVIVLNKTDLLDGHSPEDIMGRIQVYQHIGYPVILSSVLTHDGLTQLDAFLRDKTCVLVGASGVGKSSIIASLNEESLVKIGENSASTGLGKHTTTATRLYHLPHGGNLIDSPGVREFGLWNVAPTELSKGFIEFKPYLYQCQFRNCKHIKEPGCAIQAAAHRGAICEKRYANYLKIYATLSEKRK